MTTLAPEEWDFRNVKKDELRAAFEYEIFRSATKVQDAWMRWLATEVEKFDLTEDGEVVWDEYGWKWPVAEMLETIGWKVPIDALNAMDVPCWYTIPCIMQGCLMRPWLTLNEQTKARLKPYLPGYFKPKPITFVRDNPFRPPEETIIEICIDWDNFERKQIVQAFDRWVKEKNHKAKRTLRGRKSSPPYAKLRQLAAYRLRANGLQFKELRWFIEAHIKATSPAGKGYILPDYSSMSAWDRAADQAAKAIESRNEFVS